YKHRASMLAMRGLRCSSAGVKVLAGRRLLRRLKRTSFGVWMREEVARKMFSGAKYGKVERKKRKVEMKRMFRER
ncbi:MAG: hypothetical protein Q9224_006955, partial [Gallowayella concinna]